MPGFLLDESSELQCSHAPGKAKPLASNARVTVSRKKTIVALDFYQVSGCPLNTPCAIGFWTQAARRVRSVGLPLVLTDSQSTSVPNGSPLRPTSSQTRVKAT